MINEIFFTNLVVFFGWLFILLFFRWVDEPVYEKIMDSGVGTLFGFQMLFTVLTIPAFVICKIWGL